MEENNNNADEEREETRNLDNLSNHTRSNFQINNINGVNSKCVVEINNNNNDQKKHLREL